VRRRMFESSVSQQAPVTQAARWLLMLPLAAVCAGVAHIATSVGFGAAAYAVTGAASTADSTFTTIASVVASAAMAYAFVWTAVVVAPAQRAMVAQAMIGFGAAIAAIAMYDAALASGPAIVVTTQGSLASSAGFLTGLLAAGIRLRNLRR
jgi:hypothetical protein